MAQTALVTGATSGIGEALCLLFASDDFDLVTVARDKEALEKQADELRRLDIDVLPIACDLSDPDAARTIFKRVQEAGKEIEILVNDAGYSPAGQFSDLPIADIRSMIQVSVTSLAELTSVFLHPMLERGHGRILNMSSMMAKTPCPYNALYGAAKVFVLSFSTALARELKRHAHELPEERRHRGRARVEVLLHGYRRDGHPRVPRAHARRALRRDGLVQQSGFDLGAAHAHGHAAAGRRVADGRAQASARP